MFINHRNVNKCNNVIGNINRCSHVIIHMQLASHLTILYKNINQTNMQIIGI